MTIKDSRRAGALLDVISASSFTKLESMCQKLESMSIPDRPLNLHKTKDQAFLFFVCYSMCLVTFTCKALPSQRNAFLGLEQSSSMI